MVYQFLQYRIVVIGGGLSVRRCQVETESGRLGSFIDYILLVPESVIPGDLIIEFEFFQVQIGVGRDGNVNIFI